MDTVQKETHVVSVMTDKLLGTVAKVRDENYDRLLSRQIRRPRLTKGEKNPQKQTEREALQTKGAKFRAVTQIVKTRHVDFGMTGCIYGRRRCFFRHVEAEEKPSNKSKENGAKGSVALLKESTQLGCVSQDSYPRKSILLEKGKLGSKRTVNFSKALGTKWKIWKERVHRKELPLRQK